MLANQNTNSVTPKNLPKKIINRTTSGEEEEVVIQEEANQISVMGEVVDNLILETSHSFNAKYVIDLVILHSISLQKNELQLSRKTPPSKSCCHGCPTKLTIS